MYCASRREPTDPMHSRPAADHNIWAMAQSHSHKPDTTIDSDPDSKTVRGRHHSHSLIATAIDPFGRREPKPVATAQHNNSTCALALLQVKRARSPLPRSQC